MKQLPRKINSQNKINKELENEGNDVTFVNSILTLMTLAVATNAPKRPFISIKANGIVSPWLFDSGAQISCMSLNEFRKIKVENRPSKLDIQKDLRCASNNRLTVKGSYLMDLNVFDRKIKQVVFVCENLGQPAILGIDAIEKLGLIYSTRTKKFFFENESFDFNSGKLTAISAHIIPPFSALPLRVHAVTATGARPPAGLTAVATIGSPLLPLLSGGPGLVQTTQGGDVTVMIQNCAPTEMHISRGDILGSIECIEGEKIEQVNIDSIVDAIQQKENILPKSLSIERKKQMLADLNLNVPKEEREKYLNLIFNNYDVFSKSKDDLGLATHYTHKIDLKTDNPLYIKQFKIPEIHKQMLEKQVTEWLKMGIIQRSNSKYNSPVFIVPKKEKGTYRFVQDFRKLNQNCHDDKYCMKDVSECIGEIGRAGSTIFSTLDLTSGFWQMPLDRESRQYTAFTIPGMGQFEWLVSAMGIKSCPSGFQRLVELAMRGLKNAIVYIDDIIL
ncbi:MAG: reverse transcriptase family protein, partial [Limnohabitans sp.]